MNLAAPRGVAVPCYWTWSRVQQSRLHAVERSYLREACGVNRWDGVSNESVYERCGMRCHGSGMVELMGEKEHHEIV